MKLSEIVIACFNLEGMLAFYKDVFNLSFKTIEIPQGNVYEGHIEGVKITFCSASIAGITAKDNRHQLTFLTTDISSCMEKVERLGGSLMSELEETSDCKQIPIRDVDGNSMLLREML